MNATERSLMTRAAELCPKRFRVIDTEPPEGIPSERLCVVLSLPHGWSSHKSRAFELVLLAGVMEEVVGRGWAYELQDGFGGPSALVYRDRRNDLSAYGAGRSPAFALLAAFVRALESVAPGQQEAQS